MISHSQLTSGLPTCRIVFIDIEQQLYRDNQLLTDIFHNSKMRELYSV